MTASAGAFATLAREALNQGDLLQACDLAQEGLRREGASEVLAYLLVLARARLGDTEQALSLYAAHGLAGSADLDCQALQARLLKDRALQAAQGRSAALWAAAEAYGTIFARSADPYPGVNAATLARLAGRADEARRLAEAVLASPQLADAGFYAGATRTEALLGMGRVDAARAALTRACAEPDADPGARAVARRQLRLLAAHLSLAPDQAERLLAPLAAPVTLVYCGHLFEAGSAFEPQLVRAVDAALARLSPAAAYGALARGADLVIAERVLAAGLELNVVLPFRTESFLQQSVGEDGWRARFEACLARARTVTHATAAAYVGDPHQIAYGGQVAMGLARLRARMLDGEAVQLAVWDGRPAGGRAGTGADVAAWRAAGGRSEIIDAEALGRPEPPPPAEAAPVAERSLKAILFADFPGFSQLPEETLPAFWREVMRRVGAVLDRHAEVVAYRNSWGDALYAVIDTAPAAAAIAVELHEELALADPTALGLAEARSLRIGAHFGPVYRGMDFVAREMTFFGVEVSRAARIEPLTPPGAVYVTEPFAALLTLEAQDRFACAYVGKLELPKGYGAQRMYRLKRAC